MKNLLLIALIISFLNSQNIQKAFLVAIYDKSRVENVQHKTKTDFEYKEEIFFVVAIIGSYDKNTNISTKINSSKGELVDTKALYNNLTKKVYGHELTFRHLNVEKGYFEVFVDEKLYDTKVFVK